MAGVQAVNTLINIEDIRVSIPQSGWRGFKRQLMQVYREQFRGFNPSVGMAGVQAIITPWLKSACPQFQSLSRDGGGSSDW